MDVVVWQGNDGPVATPEVSRGVLSVCVLASGSSGNCTLVRGGGTSVLVDAGLSAKQTRLRLAAVGARLEEVKGIVVSHEHNDHIAGLKALHGSGAIPCYGNRGTVEGVSRMRCAEGIGWSMFATGSAFSIGEMTIEPFAVPHDAYEPVGFVFHAGGLKAGVMTDAGIITQLLVNRLSGCHVLVVEANHDEGLLQEAERPWSLKQRIRGRQGHLSNRDAAELVSAVAGPQLQRVYLAHLSEDCNRGHLAVREVREALDRKGFGGVEVELTYPDRVSAVWQG
ncbi:MAG TPA: MBL fold metallo-hydrolase [Kiritimatiellia bacterium]|nr:MBL fold metallo-hydrolase [Kiritimatiellia bacterium]